MIGTAQSAEVVDGVALLASVDGDAQLLRELIKLFQEECLKGMAEIRAALRRGDAAALKGAAHRIRGSVGNFGKLGACETARQLESLASRGDLACAEDVYARLEDAVDRLRAALRGVLEESASTAGQVSN
jgi:HPt (histidine-containing phosphotransfer) domain-containing protein